MNEKKKEEKTEKKNWEKTKNVSWQTLDLKTSTNTEKPFQFSRAKTQTWGSYGKTTVLLNNEGL